MNIISKTIEFDSAHRVPLHESKCRNLHGHRYSMTVYLSGDLFESGPQSQMVFDYGFLKEIMMQNIDAFCDHALILSLKDDKFINMAYDEKLMDHIFYDWIEEISSTINENSFWNGQTAFGKTYIINEYPTAESLAKHFFNILNPKISEATGNQAKLYSVVLKETPSSAAEYRLS
jgi:6-pyruvoyltetrahydropterin/6-carboxytetrahydropterin synthase